ncbi:MAG: hydrogenase 4 subunit F [Patescibacteria group bacterium]
MLLLVIISIPLLLAIVAGLINKTRLVSSLIVLGYLIGLVLSIALAYHFLASPQPISLFNIFYADALSIFFVFTSSIIVFAAALYSKGFIELGLETGQLSQRQAKVYFILFNIFIFSILLVTIVSNLGLMWVAIEITTLVSAFLVGFYNNKNAIEAAWKYLIICSVGIILALLGTILFSYALLFSTGIRSLDWNDFITVAHQLDPNIIKVAFIFILVGYGTKAGLAPMHTWLPDAHSQAISPISALLSGVLLKTSLYAILRYSLIINLCIGKSFSSHLFIFFGLLSLLVAAGLILVQKDIKRLLAYSSIEHVGIILFGFGVGGKIGLYGALLHIFNHAVTKSLLFFGAGNLVEVFASHRLEKIRGCLRVLPFTGSMVLLGIFALAGFPPFSIFFSEFTILIAAFTGGYAIWGSLLLLLIIITFGAILFHFSNVLLGEKPENLKVSPEPWSIKLAFIFLLFFVIFGGMALPGLFDGLFRSIIGVFGAS